MRWPAGRGALWAVESRADLVAGSAARAARHGQERFRAVGGLIADAELPERPQVVTALHACDTATDDALALAIARGADHVAVVPCCQAEVARQLAENADARDPADAALIRHALHRRELGSHLTNVVRSLCLAAHGYKVTVTELVGWGAQREERAQSWERASTASTRRAARRSRACSSAGASSPRSCVLLRARGLDPCAAVS